MKIKTHIMPCLWLLLGGGILAFGLYHVHAVSQVTEGGSLGLTLLLEHWFSVSPALSGFLMNAVCYGLGWRVLGKKFIAYSVVATAGFSAVYAVCEQFAPLGAPLAQYPLLAAVAGAMFVGVGVGLCVRAGGAPTADDALAMALMKLTRIRKIEWVYLVSDLTVLGLSLSYIPLERIAYSLVTVILSGRIIGLIQRLGRVA